MDDKSKSRYETTLKVLGWGMTVYLLILGYSITQSGMFELRWASPEENNFDLARLDYAFQLENRNGVVSFSDKAKDKAEAEKIRLEVYQDKEKRNDAWSRGLGLVLGALTFSIAFPWTVWRVSQRYTAAKTNNDNPIDDNPIMDHAIPFSIAMSVVTLCLACLTAFF
jgi:hypothetical protein